MYTQDEVKELCGELFEDLQVYEGDAELSEGGLQAVIPYYAHGRMKAHTVDLETMAKTALIYARRFIPPKDTPNQDTDSDGRE